MSRRVIAPEPQKKLATQFDPGVLGCVDFVDNNVVGPHGLASMATHPGVVGGPPAYLEAHGIRYVPLTLSSDAADDTKSADDGADMAPMNTSMDLIDPAEIDERVDRRIESFMSDQRARTGLASSVPRTRSAPRSYSSKPPLDAKPSDAYDSASMKERLGELEERIRNLKVKPKMAAPASEAGAKPPRQGKGMGADAERETVQKLQKQCADALSRAKGGAVHGVSARAVPAGRRVQHDW